MPQGSDSTPINKHTCEPWQSEQTRIAAESLLMDFFFESDDAASSRYFRFVARKHLILQLDNATSWWAISDMLSRALVPLHVQPFLICKIATSARELMAGSETVRLAVSLVVARAGAEAGRVSVFVERVGEERRGFCVICLGETMGGFELPCLHCYHKDCIESWFQNSNLCPLCRFQMPLDWKYRN